MNYQLITRKQFLAAIAKYPPSKWIKFAFKYFSESTENSDLKVRKILITSLIVLFGLMFIGAVLNVSKTLILISSILYCIILIPLVWYLFIVNSLNNRRLDKIRTELGGITISEYTALVDKFEV